MRNNKNNEKVRRGGFAFRSLASLCCMFPLFSPSFVAAAQDWSVSVEGQPPARAAVGDVVGVVAQISVDAGIDDLTVNSIVSGATTTGLSGFDASLSVPAVVSAGTTVGVPITMRVTAPPGSAGVHLQVDVDGTLGAAAADVRSAQSNSITVLEGVAATLSGGPAQVRRGAPISYKLDVVSNSDTDAELAVPDAGFAVPAGTIPVNRIRGSTMLAAGSATQFVLTVLVADSNADGAVIAMTPTGVTYAMSQVGISSRAMTITPGSVSSVVVVPLFADGFD